MQQVTKNIFKGEPISDLRELVRLANEAKSVVIDHGGQTIVRPAAFIVSQQFRTVAMSKIFYSVKVEKKANETHDPRK